MHLLSLINSNCKKISYCLRYKVSLLAVFVSHNSKEQDIINKYNIQKHIYHENDHFQSVVVPSLSEQMLVINMTAQKKQINGVSANTPFGYILKMSNTVQANVNCMVLG